jgi:hypothetical protein
MASLGGDARPWVERAYTVNPPQGDAANFVYGAVNKRSISAME